MRSAISLKRLVYIDGQKAVIYRTLKPNPRLGEDCERQRVVRQCGGKLKIVAYIHSQVAINKILDHLGLSPPQQERPPPEIPLRPRR